MPSLFDLFGWLALGGIVGFFYGRKRFDRRLSEVTATPESRQALSAADSDLKARLQAQRLNVEIAYGAIGAAVGVTIFGLVTLIAVAADSL
jgi:hypothetical protein